MPYIKQASRDDLDPLINALADRIASMAVQNVGASDTAFAGLLNYALTSVSLRVVKQLFPTLRYGTIATLTGVLANVKDEFYRRVAVPYEDQQLRLSGDIDAYRNIG